MTHERKHMLKYIIIGRTCAGKDTFAEKLRETDLTFKKSFTTRPKRNEKDEAYYYFVTEQEYAALPEKILETENNGYKYCTTVSEVLKSDVLILDPKGLYDITALFPDIIFRAIYIQSSYENRKHAAKIRDNSPQALSIFESRCDSENIMFVMLEKHIKEKSIDIKNLASCILLNNDHTKDANIFKYNDTMMAEIRLFDRILIIIDNLRKKNCLKPEFVDELVQSWNAHVQRCVVRAINNEHLNKTPIHENEYTTMTLSDAYLAEEIIESNNLMTDLMKMWLKMPNIDIQL